MAVMSCHNYPLTTSAHDGGCRDVCNNQSTFQANPYTDICILSFSHIYASNRKTQSWCWLSLKTHSWVTGRKSFAAQLTFIWNFHLPKVARNMIFHILCILLVCNVNLQVMILDNTLEDVAWRKEWTRKCEILLGNIVSSATLGPGS
jgi:hypothetical protein